MDDFNDDFDADEMAALADVARDGEREDAVPTPSPAKAQNQQPARDTDSGPAGPERR